MPKTTKCDTIYHFIHDYLYLFLNTYGDFIKCDEELNEYITKAYKRATKIISQGNLENIVEQFVLTVSEDF